MLNLSEHFTLEEMIYSPTAIRLGIDNTPSEEVASNLEALCLKVLEQVRSMVNKPLLINSGYRCEPLNKAIGGAFRSQHTEGKAADIHVEGMGIEDLYQLLKGSAIMFDQLIQEFDSWVHISYSEGKNRRQCLRATKVSGQTVYSPDNSLNN